MIPWLVVCIGYLAITGLTVMPVALLAAAGLTLVAVQQALRQWPG